MKTKEQYKEFIEKSLKTQKTIQEAAKFDVADILREKGKIEFNWEDGDAPWFASTLFKDDLTDAYIASLSIDGDTIYADLHAYYLGEDISGVDLADEQDTDWLDILSHIIDGGLELEEEQAKPNDGDTPQADVVEYAQRYGYDTLGNAIVKMIGEGDFNPDWEFARKLWEYDGVSTKPNK